MLAFVGKIHWCLLLFLNALCYSGASDEKLLGIPSSPDNCNKSMPTPFVSYCRQNSLMCIHCFWWKKCFDVGFRVFLLVRSYNYLKYSYFELKNKLGSFGICLRFRPDLYRILSLPCSVCLSVIVIYDYWLSFWTLIVLRLEPCCYPDKFWPVHSLLDSILACGLCSVLCFKSRWQTTRTRCSKTW